MLMQHIRPFLSLLMKPPDGVTQCLSLSRVCVLWISTGMRPVVMLCHWWAFPKTTVAVAKPMHAATHRDVECLAMKCLPDTWHCLIDVTTLQLDLLEHCCLSSCCHVLIPVSIFTSLMLVFMLSSHDHIEFTACQRSVHASHNLPEVFSFNFAEKVDYRSPLQTPFQQFT